MSSLVFPRALVGWDGSPGAAAGLQLGCRLTAGPGGRLIALAVVPGFSHVEDADERQREVSGVRQALEDGYQSAMAAIDLDDGAEVSLEFIEEADVGRALDHYAATHPIDLVIVGLHGREGLLHPKMGHIANHAVRSSHCPVLVVPDRAHADHPNESSEPDPSRVSALFHPFHRRG